MFPWFDWLNMGFLDTVDSWLRVTEIVWNKGIPYRCNWLINYFPSTSHCIKGPDHMDVFTKRQVDSSAASKASRQQQHSQPLPSFIAQGSVKDRKHSKKLYQRKIKTYSLMKAQRQRTNWTSTDYARLISIQDRVLSGLLIRLKAVDSFHKSTKQKNMYIGEKKTTTTWMTS